MRRREFIGRLAGTAAWPLAARAQQPTMPVVGLLALTEFRERERWAAFQRGLNEVGYIEGKNITFDYRLAEGGAERLPALAADLVRRRVDVIVTLSRLRRPSQRIEAVIPCLH